MGTHSGVTFPVGEKRGLRLPSRVSAGSPSHQTIQCSIEKARMEGSGETGSSGAAPAYFGVLKKFSYSSLVAEWQFRGAESHWFVWRIGICESATKNPRLRKFASTSRKLTLVKKGKASENFRPFQSAMTA